MSESSDPSVMTMNGILTSIQHENQNYPHPTPNNNFRDSQLNFIKPEPSFHLISNEDDKMREDVKPMLQVNETPPGLPIIPEYVNHFLTIQKNLKEERDDKECEEDPLLVVNPHSGEGLTSFNSEKPYPCEVCGKCFTRVHGLSQHKLVHTGEKPHECDMCGKRFSRNSYLAKHKRVHTGKTPHECDTCGKRFSESSNLTKHKLIHTGEKPHKCDTCGKCFNQRFLLSQHKLTHKVFECDVCGQQFTRSHRLTTHKMIHTEEKFLECNVCGKSYFQQSDLMEHKLIHKMTTHTTGENPQRQKPSGQPSVPWGFPRLLRSP